MKTKVFTILAAIMLFGVSAAKAIPVNSNSIVEDGVEYYIQTNKTIYNLGENVEIFYMVSNLTDESMTLGSVVMDPPAYYDFRVKQGDDQIWSYPYMSIVLGFGAFDLDPYESKEFQTIWNMMNDNGSLSTDDDFLIILGIYDVIGELDLIGIGDERVPVSVSIDVIPEPATLLFLGLGGLMLRRTKKMQNHRLRMS